MTDFFSDIEIPGSVEVLEIPVAVRRRPAMYIGSVTSKGVLNLLRAVCCGLLGLPAEHISLSVASGNSFKP